MKQLLFKDRHHFIKNDAFKVGTTNRNEFFPAYATFEDLRDNGYQIQSDSFSEYIVDNVFMYSKPIFCNGTIFTDFSVLTNFNSLISSFKGYNSMSVFKFKVAEEIHYLNVTGGCISDTLGNILLVLCVKSNSLTYNDVIKTMTTDCIIDDDLNYHTQNLRLMVSTEFFRNEKYKNIYKKIEKEIIQSCYNMNIDVIFTTSDKIEDNLFKNDFEVNFDNLTELNEHLHSGIGRTLFLNERVIEVENISQDISPQL